MAFFCPICEPGRVVSYGWSPGLCERHAADVAPEARPGAGELPPPDVMEDSKGRREAFEAAMRAGRPDHALAIAREPLPADWPEDERRTWSARRDLAWLNSIQPLAGRAE